jgi:hypothetical protein
MDQDGDVIRLRRIDVELQAGPVARLEMSG